MNWGRWGLAFVLLLFFGVFLIYPVGWMLSQAFISGGQITLRHFGMMLRSPLEMEALRNSLCVATSCTLLATVLALPVAHIMTRMRLPLHSVLGAALLLPMVLPPFVGAIGFKQLFAKFGTLNLLLMDLGLLSAHDPVDWLGGGGLGGIVCLQALSLYPVMYLNLSAAMSNIDPVLVEAAQGMGASGWRVFRTITFPLILPGWFAGGAVVFIWSFTDLGIPLVFGYSRVVPVRIYDSITELNTNPLGYAMVVLVLSVTVLLFMAVRRLVGQTRYEMMSRGHVGGSAPVSGKRRIFAFASVVLLLLISILPHFAVLVHSFADQWFLSPLPQGYTLDNYAEVFGNSQTAAGIRNSLFYSSLSAGLDLVLGTTIAWLLTRGRFRYVGLLDALSMIPLAVPGLVLAFGYVAGFDFNVSWLNPRTNPTFLLVVGYSIRRLPYIVRSAYAGFQQTSIALEEASANLGASPLRTFRKITLPLVAANLVGGTILTFAFAMLEVSDSLILAMREQYFPITKTIYQLVGRIEPNANSIACALGVVGMVILGVSLLIASRMLGKRLGKLFRA